MAIDIMSVVKVSLTVLLALIGTLTLCGYFYMGFVLWLGNLSRYFELSTWLRRQQENVNSKYGLVLMLGGSLAFLSCASVCVIALIWQPLLEAVPVYFFISGFVGILGAASIARPLMQIRLRDIERGVRK